MLSMPSYDVKFPLSHPRYVIEDVAYLDRTYRILGWGRHAWVKIPRSFEELLLNLRYGNFAEIVKAVKNRISKMLS
jgi:hypothetical protein